MAGEDRRYTTWIRTQPCAACGTQFGIEVHHALYGTTYSPEETRPTKAIEGARKGASQKSHDYFSIPLCLKDHTPGIHKGGGYFEGWSGAQIEEWEREQVAIHRNRYAMQAPTPVAETATSSRATRKRTGSGWTVAGIRDWCRKEARIRPAEASDALTELANLIEEDTL